MSDLHDPYAVVKTVPCSIPVRVVDGAPLCPNPFCPCGGGTRMRHVRDEMWECPIAADLFADANRALMEGLARAADSVEQRPQIRYDWGRSR